MRRSIESSLAIASLTMFCLMSDVALSETVTTTYRHFSSNADQTIPIQADPGDDLIVNITETCTDEFVYRMIGIEKSREREDSGADLAIPDCVATDSAEPLSITVSSKYSGYLVEIIPKPDSDIRFLKRASGGAACVAESADCKPIKQITLVLLLDENPWNLEFAGGFSFSELTSQRYGVRTMNVGGTDQSVVFRDAAGEDDASLGMIGMIHASSTKLPRFAVSFGLGVREDSSTDYYLGGSWRAAGQFFVTVGKQWGQVDRLPNGLREGDVIPDPNTLSNLPTRTDSALFIAVTYSFLDPGRNFFSGQIAPADGDAN